MRIIGNLLWWLFGGLEAAIGYSQAVWLLHVLSSAFLGENSISRWLGFRSHHSVRMWSWDFKVIRKKKLKDMNTLHSCLAYYLLAINAVAFIVYGIDKYKAKKTKWRIPEITLLLLAVVGGSVGAWMGMKVWHHKTMHKKFKYGIPAILLIQIALMAYLHMN